MNLRKWIKGSNSNLSTKNSLIINAFVYLRDFPSLQGYITETTIDESE